MYKMRKSQVFYVYKNVESRIKNKPTTLRVDKCKIILGLIKRRYTYNVQIKQTLSSIKILLQFVKINFTIFTKI